MKVFDMQRLLEEREMTSALENDNMVIFIDRAGYGLSDDTDNKMTLWMILSQGASLSLFQAFPISFSL